MDIKEIQNLIKFVAKSGASEVKLEIKDVKLQLKQVQEQQKLRLFKLHLCKVCHKWQRQQLLLQ